MFLPFGYEVSYISNAKSILLLLNLNNTNQFLMSALRFYSILAESLHLKLIAVAK